MERLENFKGITEADVRLMLPNIDELREESRRRIDARIAATMPGRVYDQELYHRRAAEWARNRTVPPAGSLGMTTDEVMRLTRGDDWGEN